MASSLTRRAGPVLRKASRHLTHPLLPRTTTRSLQAPSYPVETLANNKSIYVHTLAPGILYSLSFLPTTPPHPRLIIGMSTTNPPTPQTFTENPIFRHILTSVLSEHATKDPDIIAEAAGVWGASMGVTQLQQRNKRRREGGGEAAVNVGGWHHLIDRRTSYYGGMRIPEPQDILGSVEVDGEGKVGKGFMACESYRMVTNDGVVGLTEYLEGKLVERLREMEKVPDEGN